MKKLLSLTLVLFLTLLLAACGDFQTNGDDPNGEDSENYTIDLNSTVDEASFTISPESPVEAETEVTIEVHASDQHIFLHWADPDGNIISETNPYTFTPTSDVTLSAVFDSSAAESLAADEVEASFDGDLSHLNALVETLNQSNAQMMQLKLLVEEDDYQNPGETIIQTVIIEQHMVFDDDATITKFSFDATIDGEEIKFFIVLRETQNFVEIYLDVTMLLNEIEEQDEDFDVREIFDIQSNILFLSVPKEVFDDLETLLSHYLELFIDNLGQEMDVELDEALLDTMMNQLSRFEKYLNFEYYDTLDDLNVTMNRLDDTHIETILSLNGPMMAQFADDVLEDIHAYLTILDIEGLDLPSLEDIRNMPEYVEIMDEMHAFEANMNLSTRYEPYYANRMVIHFDLFDFLMQMDDVQEGIHSFDIELTREVGTDITIPSDTKNIAHIASEALPLVIFMDANSIVSEVEDAIEWLGLEDGTYNLHDLESYSIYRDMTLYDNDLSTIVVDGETITADLYYAYNQEAIFNAPIDQETFEQYSEMDVPTRSALLEILEYMDEDNLNIYSLMMYTLETFLDEIAGTVEETTPMP